MRRDWEFYDCFRSKQAAGFEFHARPIREILPAGLGTDGPAPRGRFISREANSLAPGTPPEHIAAMYDTVRHYGQYATAR